MNDLLKNDVVLRIISVICAVFLWIYVVNVQNPDENREVKGIKVKKTNVATLADRNLKVINDREVTININVKGKHNTVKTLGQEDFDVEIDYSRITGPGTNRIAIDEPKCLREGVTIFSYTPNFIDVTVETIEQKTYGIEIVTTGQPKSDYTVIGKDIKPNSITLKEIKSIMDRVASVKVMVDVTGIEGDLEIKRNIVVQDQKGNPIPELENTIPQADVKINVARAVPLEPVLKGNPAEGYYTFTTFVDPQKVLVTGPKDVISKLTKLTLEPISVEGKTSSFRSPGTLKTPKDVVLVNPNEPFSVMADIREHEKKEVTFNNFILTGKNDKYDYEIQSTGIKVTIKARPDLLESYNPANTILSIPVTNLAPGTHKITVPLKLPDGIKPSVDSLPIDVKITEKKQETQQ